MGWSWVSLSTLRPSRPTSADPSLAPAAVLLQMKLPASLLGPYSHMPTASGWGWPPPSVPRCRRRRRLRLRRHLRSPGGPLLGRVETRVCVVESCWSPLDNVISVDSVSGPDSTPTAPTDST